MPHRPKLPQTRSSLFAAAAALASLINPFRAVLGQTLTGQAAAVSPTKLVARLDTGKSPKTRFDEERIAEAKERRVKRALKQAIRARRTVLGKYNPTLPELQRAREMMEAIHANA